jgi:hypothetical protein
MPALCLQQFENYSRELSSSLKLGTPAPQLTDGSSSITVDQELNPDGQPYNKVGDLRLSDGIHNLSHQTDFSFNNTLNILDTMPLLMRFPPKYSFL